MGELAGCSSVKSWWFSTLPPTLYLNRMEIDSEVLEAFPSKPFEGIYLSEFKSLGSSSVQFFFIYLFSLCV